MRAALFDLDGTLVDTAPDIHAAASAMLAELNQPPLPIEEARTYIGDGVGRFVKRALTRQWWGEPPEQLQSRALELMYQHYAQECTSRLLCYEGVRETLRALADDGVMMACVTNKPRRFTKPLLSACKLDKFFKATISGDTLPVKKPDPAPIINACEIMGANVKDAWMVGDSLADSKAAAAAGCKFAVVAYGYHRAGMLPPADAVLQNFADVLSLYPSATPSPVTPAHSSVTPAHPSVIPAQAGISADSGVARDSRLRGNDENL